MSWKYVPFLEKKCSVCGKKFIVTPEWVYKTGTVRGNKWFCSWGCKREHEKATAGIKKQDRRRNRMKKQEKPKAKWLVFNVGTDLEFAECSNCGCELNKDKYDEYDMPQRCYKCGAEIVDVEYPD